MILSDRILGPLLALCGLAVIRGALALPKVPGVRFGADLLPLACGAALVLFGGLILLAGLRAEGRLADLSDWRVGPRAGLAAAWSLGGLALAVWLFQPLGFPIVGTVFMAGMMALMGARVPVIAVVAPVFTLVLYLVFTQGLRVSLPAGPLGGLLP